MFRFVKAILFTEMTFFSCNVLNVISLKCVCMNNQKSKIRIKIISVNSNKPSFYSYSIKVNKCRVVVIMCSWYCQKYKCQIVE